MNQYESEFALRYEKFRNGCDALEEEGRWPVDELGEMEAYFDNDLACVIIRLIAADGRFFPEEVDSLNRALGFHYSVDTLKAIYADCGERINALFETELDDSLALLNSLEPKLGEAYRQLLILLAKVVTESDGGASDSEKAAAAQLFALLQ
ncbi:MAG: TerB family tellurite resistance protein [Oscillospiraceae bacterium]|nr:TerB family tellurite resistance protein [Oscillospiraceae bacterium]